MRREIPETVRFNLLAFHAGAQWAPVLFNYRESEMVGNQTFKNGMIVGFPNLTRDGAKNGATLRSARRC